MRHHDPRGVHEAKTAQEPTEDPGAYRREGAEPDALVRYIIVARFACGHSQEFRNDGRRQKRDGEMH
jgi:hypothetical protein